MAFTGRQRFLASFAVLSVLALGCDGSTAGPGGRGGAGGFAGTTGAAGASGASGTTGAAGIGGASGTMGPAGIGGARGTAGVGGTGGTPGSTGVAGTGGVSNCSFTINTSLAPAIPTVGVVTFTTGLTGMTRARIEFGLAAGGPMMTAPVDLAEPEHRTLLLGMKQSSTYVFRIVATAGSMTCTSDDQTIATGVLSSSAFPKPTVTIMNAGAHTGGFILTSFYNSPNAFIIDSDGDVVWGATLPGVQASRVHMGWDGKDLYGVRANPGNGVGRVGRISMDGTTFESDIPGLQTAHHDLTAIPGGIATLVWNQPGSEAPNSVVERLTDGTLTTVIADLGTVYNAKTGPGSTIASAFHPNSIHYHAWDDSYTIGDRFPSLYVKITRKGQLVWQFGGKDPKDPTKMFEGLPAWSVNHGHHLLADGTFLFFNNYESNVVRMFKLDTVNMTATSLLTYEPAGKRDAVLGDVQRLPNGNILVTFCESQEIHEITSTGRLVAVFGVAQELFSRDLGYAEFRESLYGPAQY